MIIIKIICKLSQIIGGGFSWWYKTHKMPKSLRMMARVFMLLGSFLITFLVAQYFIWTYCTLSCLSLLVAYLYILSMYVSNALFILSLPFSLPVDFHSLSRLNHEFAYFGYYFTYCFTYYWLELSRQLSRKSIARKNHLSQVK